MGIYIPKMTMPEDNCDAFCEIIITNNFVDGKIQMLAHDLQTNEFIGEAIKLPPHGRLIDADALEYTDCEHGVLYDVANAPIIIESEGEDGG